jgi:signal transduction histidine kinase
VQSRTALNRAIDAYLELPLLPPDRDSWLNVFRDREALMQQVQLFESYSETGNLDAAEALLSDGVARAASNLNETLTDSIHGEATLASAFAKQIRSFRTQATYLAFGLDIVCATVAILGAVLARRLIRANTELLRKRRQLLEERATELDEFAGRIAHDVLSPLATVLFVLQLSEREPSDEKRRQLLGRGLAASERIKRLVTGLLEFARAGGKPKAGAEADLDVTLADVAAELAPAAADARAELIVCRQTRYVLACDPGVLTSLISNLARNAVKYLGDAPVRKVEIRAKLREERVRIEVVDTGPGVPSDLEPHIFEPYVRGKNIGLPGFGLGLATVKRLAEAHGGKVGVTTSLGHGSTFWFELPSARAAAGASVTAGRAAMAVDGIEQQPVGV